MSFNRNNRVNVSPGVSIYPVQRGPTIIDSYPTLSISLPTRRTTSSQLSNLLSNFSKKKVKSRDIFYAKCASRSLKQSADERVLRSRMRMAARWARKLGKVGQSAIIKRSSATHYPKICHIYPTNATNCTCNFDSNNCHYPSAVITRNPSQCSAHQTLPRLRRAFRFNGLINRAR